MKRCKWCKTSIENKAKNAFYCSRKCGENFRRGFELKPFKNPRKKPLDDNSAREELLAHGLKMIGEYVGTVHKNQPSRCLSCGSQANPRIASLRMGQGGCIPCGLAAGGAKRRLSDREAEKEFLSYGFKMHHPYVGKVDKPQRCECIECNRETSPSLTNLRRKTKGCKFCAGNVALSEEEAKKELLGYNLKMIGSYVGNVRTPQPCQCLICKDFVSPHIATLRAGGSCLSCANAAHPGSYNRTIIKRRSDRWTHQIFVYLKTVECNGKTWVKVGIGTQHRANEYSENVLLIFPAPLALAYYIETEILSAAKRVKVPNELWPKKWGGRTEVVASVEVAWIELKRWERNLPELLNDPTMIQLVENWLRVS